MPTVNDVLHCLELFAPYELAESWDNCGLMTGDRTRKVERILCALDATEDVIAEAIRRDAQVVVAHHPLIFTSVHCVTEDDATGRALRQAIRHDIAVICMHTNADCAKGGVNDALAAALGLSNVINMEAGENKMLGRVGDLPARMSPKIFAEYVKDSLDAGGVRFTDGGKPIRRVAVGGGACGKMMDCALAGQNSKPLVLVDGVERSFNNIDPEDIESFTVLKDASTGMADPTPGSLIRKYSSTTLIGMSSLK